MTEHLSDSESSETTPKPKKSQLWTPSAESSEDGLDIKSTTLKDPNFDQRSNNSSPTTPTKDSLVCTPDMKYTIRKKRATFVVASDSDSDVYPLTTEPSRLCSLPTAQFDMSADSTPEPFTSAIKKNTVFIISSDSDDVESPVIIRSARRKNVPLNLVFSDSDSSCAELCNEYNTLSVNGTDNTPLQRQVTLNHQR
jgi:hypothetical protein